MNLRNLIIFEDDNLVAINKPSGMLSIPDREGKEVSLKALLKEKYGDIFVVHRIDRDTSGLIIFAKNEKAHRHFSMQFENRETRKIYLGLVLGIPHPPESRIDSPIAENMVKRGFMIVHRRGKEAITDYKLLQEWRSFSWMQFQIHTGRTHQIRVHMKDIGHPLACDELYGDGKPILLSAIKKKFNLSRNEESERPLLDRLALHASELSIRNLDDQIITLTAELPKDLAATRRQLEKWV